MVKERRPRCDFSRDEFNIHLEASIPASVDQIEPLVQRVLKLVQEIGCGKGNEFEIETALREALANAVLHGCAQDPSKSVGVSIGCAESSGILIVVRDPGTGFDPDSVPCPLIGENLYADHGRGIFLINELMDEVAFKQGGTEIHMIKRTE